jgi:hypothetical protein
MTVEELQQRIKDRPVRFLTAEQRMLREWQLPNGCLLCIRRKRDGHRVYGIKVEESDYALCIQSPNSPVVQVWIGFADPDHYYYTWDPQPLDSQKFDINRVA